MYETFAEYHKWNVSIKEIANHASSAATKKVECECLWRNYE